MIITRHLFRDEADMPRVLDLIASMPFSCRHVIDFPWRLTSPTINEGHDAAFWENADGRVVGFAAWQYYWAALDFYILSGPEMQTVAQELFAWADGRFRELDEERGQVLPYWAEFRDDDLERKALIEAHGFHLDEHACYVLYQHPLVQLPVVPVLPDGFVLRPLMGESEAAEYAALQRAAFESPAMTTEWRMRTIRSARYKPELNIVISAPDGTLVGFCVGWLDPVRRIAQIEPLGVHPHYQHLGLGRILLLEILHRFKEHGADSAIVETNVERNPARRAYESVGFHQIHTIRRMGKMV